MASTKIIFIFYIGFLCFIKNVLSHELNIQNLLRSHYSIYRFNKNGISYTEILPSYSFYITKVLDGLAVLWEERTNQYCKGVTMLKSIKTGEELLIIDIINCRRNEKRYFSKFGSFYLEISEVTFNSKLSIIETVSTPPGESQDKVESKKEENKDKIEQEKQEREREKQNKNKNKKRQNQTNETQKNKKQGKNKNKKQKVQQDKGVNTEELSVETADKNVSEQPTEDDIISQYQIFTETLETPDQQTQQTQPIQPTQDTEPSESASLDQSLSDNRLVLDITDPEKNRRVMFDYEINDGTPTLLVKVKDNKKVNIIYQDNNLIWRGEEDCKLVDIAAYSDYGEFQLIQFFYTKNEEGYHKYFRKKLNVWVEVNVSEFEETMKVMKSKITIVGYIELDVSNPKNTNFLVSQQNRGNFNIYTYYPNTGYHLILVEDGDKTIWGSDEKRCLAAIVVKENGNVKLLKLEIFKNEGETTERFYKKIDGDYVRIEEAEFESFLQNTDVEYQYPSHDTGSELPPQQEYSLEGAEGYQQNQNYQPQDTYQHENAGYYSHPQYHQQQQEEEETVDYQVEHEGNKPHGLIGESSELQLLDPVGCGVIDDVYLGVIHRSFIPPAGKVFDAIKLGDSLIWESVGGEYSDFVRVFYPNLKPILGFLRLNDVNTDLKKDIYFVNYEGSWAFVTPEYFVEVFNQCSGDPSYQT